MHIANHAGNSVEDIYGQTDELVSGLIFAGAAEISKWPLGAAWKGRVRPHNNREASHHVHLFANY
jgi:hypothetical protein